MLFLTGFGFMFYMETVRPVRQWEMPRARRFYSHAALAALNTVILRLLIASPLLVWIQLVRSSGWGLAVFLGLKGVYSVLGALILLDLIYYWWHRFNHRIPFLWRFHKVHHVDTHVDLSTSLRFHPGELLISAVSVQFLWILLWGGGLWSFSIGIAGITMASQFHHSNIDFRNPLETFLRNVIVTPRYHASHHTVSVRTGNANFSTIFIFWDKLFGTYREPDFEEMRSLGLNRGRENYLSFKSILKGPFSSDY